MVFNWFPSQYNWNNDIRNKPVSMPPSEFIVTRSMQWTTRIIMILWRRKKSFNENNEKFSSLKLHYVRGSIQSYYSFSIFDDRNSIFLAAANAEFSNCGHDFRSFPIREFESLANYHWIWMRTPFVKCIYVSWDIFQVTKNPCSSITFIVLKLSIIAFLWIVVVKNICNFLVNIWLH